MVASWLVARLPGGEVTVGDGRCKLQIAGCRLQVKN